MAGKQKHYIIRDGKKRCERENGTQSIPYVDRYIQTIGCAKEEDEDERGTGEGGTYNTYTTSDEHQKSKWMRLSR